MRKRGNKYSAQATYVDGIRFDSKKEARRYQELRLLERAGEVLKLELQPSFKLHSASGAFICKYTADFAYYEKGNPKRVIEETKGYKTRDYKIRAKWFVADYQQYDFREI